MTQMNQQQQQDDVFIYRGEKIDKHTRQNVTEIQVDESVSCIPDRAFAYWQALHAVHLPETVTAAHR